MMDLAADDKSKITTHPANQVTQCNLKFSDLKLPHSRQNQTYDDYESRRFASLLRCKLEEQTVSSLFRLAIARPSTTKEEALKRCGVEDTLSSMVEHTSACTGAVTCSINRISESYC